jgi:integrase/recombinase XerC
MTTFLDEFTAYLQAQDRSPHTVKAYHSDVTAFFDWLTAQLGKPVPPVEVTPFDVQKYRDHLVAEGRKPAGVNRSLAALRVFFAWAMQAGQASTNPARDVQGIQQAQRTPKALTTQEVYRLQRTAAAQRQLAQARAGDVITPTLMDAIRDEALLNLLLYTGLRVSECAALRVDDVLLNGKNGKVIVRSGKGRKYREVPLHKEARKVLEAYLAVRATNRGDALFLGQRGPLGARGIQFRIAALGEVAGVVVTPHVLRHTFATRLLREVKTDLVTVAALLGHSSVATTAIYTQPNEQDLSAAVAGLA